MSDKDHECDGGCDCGQHAFLHIGWDKGEQAWKFWITEWFTERESDHLQRIKFLTKRRVGGEIEGVLLMECEDGSKEELGRNTFASASLLEREKVTFFTDLEKRCGGPIFVEEQDFTRCDTPEKWEYMVREGTLNQIRCENEDSRE